MTVSTETPVSTQIYKSKDRIRNQIIEKMKEYLELDNVDLTKSSFLSFVTDVLSSNVSNLMFYQISAYKEFFLTKAQLPGSVYNLSAFLGYKPKSATTAKTNVMFTIPFGFSDTTVQIVLDEGFKVTAGDVKFVTYYTTTITIEDNSEVTIVVKEGNRTYNFPVVYTLDSFSFSLPFKQYSISIQEFQISEDLQQYQFVSIDVPFDSQISGLTVEIRPSDSIIYETYSEVSSLYLMDHTTKGYVSRRSDEGTTLQFGNGLIGYQPEPGSTVKVTLLLTEGVGGNVIAGSISSGDRVYHNNSSGVTQIVSYSVVNTSPAYNGADEENLEAIRRNAITNITALERIVTENDFKNANIIIKDSPIGQNSLPVLKRSDLKINEIALFSTIYFATDLVPTKNLYESFTDTVIPRETIITRDGIIYQTVFDMEIDILNSSANYTYIMYEIEKIPSLVTNYGSEYDMYASQLTVSKDDMEATYTLDFECNESDPNLLSCEMEISETGAKFDMINDGTAFIYVFADYRIIPNGDLTYFFTIKHATIGYIAQYSSQFIFILSLNDFTTSNVITDGTTHIVYDIPTIKSLYYNTINQRDFELQVLQQLLTTMAFKDYKMLTDFINFKFSNTTGSFRNMQLNDVNLTPVISILSDPPPTSILVPDGTSFVECYIPDGQRYIVANGTGDWKNHSNDIAISQQDSTGISWVFIEPKTDQMIYVISESIKYIYNGTSWNIPIYDIPLQISVDIFKSDTYTGTLGNLTQKIRTDLVSAFTSRFGINTYIYRSEIIDIIQSIDGVDHCHLIKPESSVFLKFNIDDFDQEQLLEYSPEYFYFTEDSIAIRVF